jgi:hypothetical protein
MTKDDYRAVLQRAVDEPFGVVLSLRSHGECRRAASRIYHVREKLRRNGDRSFDALSILRSRNCPELRIVRRDALIGRSRDDMLQPDIRPLPASEVPDRFGASNFRFRVKRPKRSHS